MMNTRCTAIIAEAREAMSDSFVSSVLHSMATTISLITLLVVCIVVIVVLVLCRRTRTKTGIVPSYV